MSVGYRGRVDVRVGSRIKGWCASVAGQPGSVRVYVNNIFKGEFPAFLPRADLQKNGTCHAGGGFELDASALSTFGVNKFWITDPDGSILDNGEFSRHYRDIICGETAMLFGDLSSKKIGLFGNARFARDTSIGTCMSKILHCIGIETEDEPTQDDATRNLWHCFPHREKPKGYSSTINFGISDISKSGIDKIHSAIFGRSVCVDPGRLESGQRYVIKSEANAAHDGHVKFGRDIVPDDAKSAVIQRLIDNRNSEDSVLDLRVPVIGKTIPHVILKTRPIGNRFSNSNTTASVTRTENILSVDEVQNVLEFSRKVGLDYGELDILRDAHSGDIWIVDVNNTPCGPANGLSQSEQNLVIREQAIAFYNEFLR